MPFVSIIAFERLNASFEPYSLGEKSPFGHLEAFRMEKGLLSIKVPFVSISAFERLNALSLIR